MQQAFSEEPRCVLQVEEDRPRQDRIVAPRDEALDDLTLAFDARGALSRDIQMLHGRTLEPPGQRSLCCINLRGEAGYRQGAASWEPDSLPGVEHAWYS